MENLRKWCIACNLELSIHDVFSHYIDAHCDGRLVFRQKNGNFYMECMDCGQWIADQRFVKHWWHSHAAACQTLAANPIGTDTKKAASEMLDALNEAEMNLGKIVPKHLERRRNAGLGKFGLPQDKYRHNFFGNKTMIYDVWAQGEKKKRD